ncbi:MAG: hypothetical protein JTT12_05565 [Candidatus Brockarchaeota archaeon]|nr:hypothetical protein [Candidatus Brockarchaeota archaeon]
MKYRILSPLPVGKNLFEAEVENERVLLKVYTRKNKDSLIVVPKDYYNSIINMGKKVMFLVVTGNEEKLLTQEEFEKDKQVYIYEKKTKKQEKKDKTKLVIVCSPETKSLFYMLKAKYMFKTHEDALLSLLESYSIVQSYR